MHTEPELSAARYNKDYMRVCVCVCARQGVEREKKELLYAMKAELFEMKRSGDYNSSKAREII
jgi:hypothetical protein